MAGSNGSIVEAASVAADKTSTPSKDETNETEESRERRSDDVRQVCYQDDGGDDGAAAAAAADETSDGRAEGDRETERAGNDEATRRTPSPPAASPDGVKEGAPAASRARASEQAGKTQSASARASEPSQVSINGTTFYHVNPAILRGSPVGAAGNQLVANYNYTGAYGNTPPNLMPYIQHYHHPSYHHHHHQQPSPPLLVVAPVYLIPDHHHYYWPNRQASLPGPLPYTLPFDMIHPAPYVGPLPPVAPITANGAPLASALDPLMQQISPSAATNATTTTTATSSTDVSQLKLGYNLLPLLPINAIPTRVRQAYGMDEVWQDEFEQLFSQFGGSSQVVWTLVEVETNPSIRSSSRILAYKSRYIVRVDGPPPSAGSADEADGGSGASTASAQDGTESEVEQTTSGDDEFDESSWNDEADDEHNCCSTGSNSVSDPAHNARKDFRLKFRMFIDSAKVRFCCDNCGHGWTSMKGRVVFWYELFELVDGPDRKDDGVSNLIGYCAYKLFGQQCDICKIENRFERPMWYPEEVTKVLCNLFNKIGQVYFGLRMPTIDKQRRAGKPKTSHNSLLCQACHDGVCTDRK